MSAPGQRPWYATSDEISELSEELRDAHRSLLAALYAFPSPDWEKVGSDGGWSAGQIVEHIFLAQRVLRDRSARICKIPYVLNCWL